MRIFYEGCRPMLPINPARNTGVSAPSASVKPVCTYHLAFSCKCVTTSKQIVKPRHLVLFRVKKNVVEVARLLHEAMGFVPQGV